MSSCLECVTEAGPGFILTQLLGRFLWLLCAGKRAESSEISS